MTPIESFEIQSRIDGLRIASWTPLIKRALKALKRPSGPVKAVASGDAIALSSLIVSMDDVMKDSNLRQPLRDHNLKGKVSDEDEIALRDALDRALLQAQIYEMAIATGYLPTSALWKVSRELLTGLLWSQSARNFLQTYEYPAVTMLAERVGVHGLRRPEMASPSDNKTKALQFAGFLAHLHTFYEDACIQEWISFLDDFLGEDDEQNRLWNFLCGSSPDEPTRFGILVEGALSFVESMSDAFGVLDKKEFAQYGMPHAYWLQKFFGYVLTEKGYERDPAYEKDASWASLLVSRETLIYSTSL